MQTSFPASYPPVVVGSVASLAALDIARRPGLTCDWLELRVDGLLSEMSVCDMERLRMERPLLVTVRAAEEGGMYQFDSHAARAQLALRLLPSATAIDWEIAYLEEAQAVVQGARAAGVKVIASAHDFEKTPSVEELVEKERFARSLGVDIVKFAFRLQSAEDISVGLQLLQRRSGPLAVMGMGPLGPVSRLLYAQYGSCLVYGYTGDVPTAPGQWSTTLFRAALGALSPVG